MQIFLSISSNAFFLSSSVISVNTSNFLSALPPTTPKIAAASIPFIPLELGTVTDLTFLIMFPEQFIVIFSGISPRTSRDFAEAYAIAIGSVQPRAGINSIFKILI